MTARELAVEALTIQADAEEFCGENNLADECTALAAALESGALVLVEREVLTTARRALEAAIVVMADDTSEDAAPTTRIAYAALAKLDEALS